MWIEQGWIERADVLRQWTKNEMQPKYSIFVGSCKKPKKKDSQTLFSICLPVATKHRLIWTSWSWMTCDLWGPVLILDTLNVLLVNFISLSVVLTTRHQNHRSLNKPVLFTVSVNFRCWSYLTFTSKADLSYFNGHYDEIWWNYGKNRAGVVGAIGKISVFRPQGPRFDPRLCQDSNICATFFSA